MTDLAQDPSGTPVTGRNPLAGSADLHTSDKARNRRKVRERAEFRFKAIGFLAICVSVLFLVILLGTTIRQAIPAFTYSYLTLEVELPQEIDPENTGDPDVIRAASFTRYLRSALEAELPFVSGRSDRRLRNRLLSSGSDVILRGDVMSDPSMIGQTHAIMTPVSDFADLYFKGLLTDRESVAVNGRASVFVNGDDVTISSTSNDFQAVLAEIKTELQNRAEAMRTQAAGLERSVARSNGRIADMESAIASATGERRETLEKQLKNMAADRDAYAYQIERLTGDAESLEARALEPGRAEELDETLPSYLVRVGGGVVKLATIGNSEASGEAFIPVEPADGISKDGWTIERLTVPEDIRKLNDKEIVWLDHLNEEGLISSEWNTIFFTYGASREPEMAGIWGAVVGSFLTLVVTLAITFPLGVSAAIYLEEFAPKNRWTDLIEVNINNLAAVPSIVFGLLGLAVFLNIFGMPRSAPLVGGCVLALMTLPTIIIASRAALKAVPPSIRDAALGIGASKLQAVLHHVLPLAMPGILTGTIIGMAQALGETAPLLMIGMVAFIVDIPGGFFDQATVLPVQIYMWADFPEPGFRQKTSAAILVLLTFLVLMNALAVVLRKRFERRW